MSVARRGLQELSVNDKNTLNARAPTKPIKKSEDVLKSLGNIAPRKVEVIKNEPKINVGKITKKEPKFSVKEDIEVVVEKSPKVKKISIPSEYYYFTVDGVKEKDILDTFLEREPRENMKYRYEIELNDKQLVLVKYNHKIYAFDQKCPHQGAKLVLGDIEDLGFNEPIIRCKAHQWRFSIQDGKCHFPSHGAPLSVYPVEVDSIGNIKVGFNEFSSKCFRSCNF